MNAMSPEIPHIILSHKCYFKYFTFSSKSKKSRKSTQKIVN